MKTIARALSALMLLTGLFLLPAAASAQTDAGARDSLYLEFTAPNANDALPKLEVRIYAFDDANTVVGLTSGFKWDNPKAVLDTGFFDPAILTGFDLVKQVYRNNNKDSSNSTKTFQVALARLFGPGLSPSASRRLLATYRWNVPGWTVSDQIIVDTNEFNSGATYKFVNVNNASYIPVYKGRLVIKDPNAPTLTLSASPNLVFNATEGGANPATQWIQVTETAANANIAYTSTEIESWMSLIDPNGTTPDSIGVSVDITGLAEGAYVGYVAVVAPEAGNSPESVLVTLNVAAAPKTLVVDPAQLTFAVELGQPDPAGQQITVTEAGGGVIAYTSTKTQPWLTLSTPNGNTPGSVQVFVAQDGLSAGVYVDTVTITSAGAIGSPKKVAVEFTVTDPPPQDFARLQVIHNAADPGAATVDVYVNGDLFLDNFDFREATAFQDVPANLLLNVGIAPGNSSSAADTVANFQYTLTKDQGYILIANGVLSPGSFEANPDSRSIAFTLFAKTPAREEAIDPTKVEFFAVHGATDAPTVDIDACGVGTLVEDAAYGDLTDYIAVSPGAYTLQVRTGDDNDQNDIVAAFAADLSGLAGQSAVVLASGFLTPFNDQNGAEFALIAVLANGTVVTFPVFVPTIEVSPTALTFTAVEGTDPASKTFDVTSDCLPADYISSEQSSWISLANFFGNTNATVTVDIDSDTLAPGTYTDSIEVNSEIGDGDPAYVVVTLTVTPKPAGPTARLQVIHNAADPAASVDIYVNGDIFLNDFNFREATAFVDVPANVVLNVGVALNTSESAADTIANFAYTLDSNTSYILIANGVLDPASFEANPDSRPIGFTLLVKTPARETALDPTKVEFFVVHGSTDAPTVDVDACGVGTLVEDAAYSDLTDYIAVAPASYTLLVRTGDDADVNDVVAGFEADLSGLTGKTAVVLASGFLTPANDQNGAAFALIAVLADGTVITLPAAKDDLVATPNIFNIEVLQNQIPTGESFEVTSVCGIKTAFTLEETAGYFEVTPTSGITPQIIDINFNTTGLGSGEYSDTIFVVSAEAGNSPVPVIINLLVVPCPELSLSAYTDTITVTENELIDYLADVSVNSTRETGWVASGDSGFSFDPAFGTTPAVAVIGFTGSFAQAGSYTRCATFATAELPACDTCDGGDEGDGGEEGHRVGGGPYGCYDSVQFCLVINVTGTPSADTVLVETVPAVPGMLVTVPVSLANSCNTTDIYTKLTWDATKATLESVNYDDSRIEELANKSSVIEIIDSVGYVTLTATTDSGDALAPGSGLWANLVFSVMCETGPGFYPITLAGDSGNPRLTRNCGNGIESETPIFVSGGIVVDSAANYVCGYVVDPLDNAIAGATVLLYGDFPGGLPVDSTFSASGGNFAFANFNVNPFDLYAYKEGYYPGKLENLQFGAKGVKIVLTPIRTLTPTSEWVDYYCDGNTYFGAPLPIGSVVEASTPGGLLVGQWQVTEAGKYGFMPVYRANETFGDDGAVTGDVISFTINGLPALPTGNTVYPAEYAQVEVCLEAGATITKVCSLLEGWNLVSWNVNTESDALVDVLGPYMDKIDVVLGFEQGGLTYEPDLPQFSTLWYVDHLSGYWIKVKPGQSFNLTIEGAATPVNTPIDLTTGWNLVSYLPNENLATADGFASVENLLFAYGWDNGIEIYAPGNPNLNSLTELAPCNGYWLKVSADDELIYPGGTTAAPRQQISRNAVALGSDVRPTTAWVNLYASNLTLDGSVVEAGSTIKAISSQGMVLGSFSMTSNGTFGFMPVYADANGESTLGLLPGDNFRVTINGVETAEEFTWTANGDRIELTALSSAAGNGGTVPSTYSLSQNYPNPFNPTTTLSFSLPQAGKATVEVLNLLGQVVATPFDGSAQAGETQVTWNGTDATGSPVASGVYFYRLTSGSFSETRKMMLLK